MINVDPLDDEAMDRMGCSMNAVSLVRYQRQHPQFSGTHAKVLMIIYTALSDLAEETTFGHIPGGNERDVSSRNARVETTTKAIADAILPTPRTPPKPAETKSDED